MRGFFAGAVVLLGVSACGSSSSGGVVHDAGPPKDSGPSATTVAGQFAMADCSKKFACMAYANETRAFGDDVSDCTTQETGYWTRMLTAPGVSTDYSSILACVQLITAASCQDYLDSTFGLDPMAMPACSAITPGTVQSGKGCVYGRQCESGACSTPDGQCGKCVALVDKEGADCDPVKQPCDPSMGLLCSKANHSCLTAHGRGSSCDQNGDCYYNLLCDTAAMKCSDYPLSGGALCVPDGVPPAAGDGLGCSFQLGAGLWCSSMGMCTVPNMNGLGGAACGIDAKTGGLDLCGVGYLCDGVSTTFAGTCVVGHAAAAGGACAFSGVEANGPACEAEAQCVKGKCTIADPTSCK